MRLFTPLKRQVAVGRYSYSYRNLSVTSGCFQTFKVAIVGAGPAGFYTAHHLLHKCPPQTNIEIDFIEKLPAPYGLSRYGVAPDHPEVKNCEEYLDNIMQTFGHRDNSQGSKARFFGNVDVGKDISLQDLQSCYHSIVLSYGCTAADNKLSIPGANLKGIISARQFVHWYNSHPDFYNPDTHFVPPDLLKIENVTIIGNGNVAMDVARVLLGNSTHWKSTDIALQATEMLQKSQIKQVNIVARRGILQSAFTNKEIRELLELSKLQNIQFNIDSEIFKDIDIKSLGRIDKRKVSLLQKYSQYPQIDNPDKSWNLQYLKGPRKFLPDENNPNQVEATEVVINELKIDNLTGKVSVIPTSKLEIIKNDLVILSIGYSGIPLYGFEDVGIKFENNKLVNNRGRILSIESNKNNDENPIYKKGWYTSGWIKNGPQGVIATTMMDSFDTAEIILEDLNNGIYLTPTSSITEYLDSYVDWEGWNKLNNYEIKTGQELGKSRLKVCRTNDMLDIECK